MSKFPETSDGYKLSEWLDGEADCNHGRPCAVGRSEHYENGYGYAYWRAESKAWESENANRNAG